MGDLSTKEIYKIWYPSTTLTDNQINAYIELSSEAIQAYLNRDLAATTRIENHMSAGDNIVILDEYPVNSISRVYASKALWATLVITYMSHPLLISAKIKYTNGQAYLDVTNQAMGFTKSIEIHNGITEFLDNAVLEMADVDITATYTIQSPCPLAETTLNIYDVVQTQGHNNMRIELYGIDLGGRVTWMMEDDRTMVLNRRIPISSNGIQVLYNAGYTLPSTTNYGTLPRAINDACNRVVAAISATDANGGANMQYKREKLGNAEYANWDGYAEAAAGSYVTGLVQRFVPQIDKYRKIDVAYY
jgi:hypothetical protein